MDHCTIFVVVVVILPDKQVLRKSRQVVQPVDYLSVVIILPIIDGEIRKINRSLTRLAGGMGKGGIDLGTF